MVGGATSLYFCCLSSHSPLAVSVHLGALLEELQRVHKLEVLWDTPFRRGQQTQGRHVAQLPR